MRRLAAFPLSLLFLISAEPASAQSLEPLRVPLHMGSTAPWVDMELRDAEGNPVSRCSGHCRLELPVGHYELFVYRNQQLLGHRPVHLEEPARWYVHPPDPNARQKALGMAIAGMVMVTAGVIMLSYDILEDMDYDGGDLTPELGGIVGLGFIVGGAITTPIGWSNYRHSRLRIDREPLLPEPPNPSSSFSPRIQLTLSF